MMRKDVLRARVLNSLAADEVLAELHARGSDKSAVEMILSRGLGRALLVGPIALDDAQTIRQAAKQAGALAVLAKTAGRADPSRAEVVIMGSADQLAATAAAVGSELGARIQAALQGYAAPSARLLRARDREIALGERTLIMGVINVTPDSFSGDGLGTDADGAVARARQMVADGADFLDIGGESTRPGSEPIGEEEEIARVLPVIERLSDEVDVPLAIDTYKSVVAKAALAAGAHIVNDISGLHHDENMAKVAADAGAAVCVMHIQGTPRDMQKEPKYADVIGEISDYLEEGLSAATGAGLSREQVILDPGIGFGKKLEHNLEILRRLREFRALSCPLLVGTSRKSMIGMILDLPADQRVEGTAATVALAIAGGADIVRVHDVKEMSRVAKVADAIVRVKHELQESEHSWTDKPKQD
jgi:dihydropteroate synthase